MALLKGRDPSTATVGDSIGRLVNAFLDVKDLQRERGELNKRMFDDYKKVAKQFADYFNRGRKLSSIRATDFELYRNSLPKSWGPVTINGHLRLTRTIFKYANAIEATDRPIAYAIGLKQVAKPVQRKYESNVPAKAFSMQEN